MTYIRKAGYFTAGLISMGLLSTGAAQSEGKFDLSPEQSNRLRVEKAKSVSTRPRISSL